MTHSTTYPDATTFVGFETRRQDDVYQQSNDAELPRGKDKTSCQDIDFDFPTF
jgi:hypothetical protein